jgi:hypothetical protein
MMTRIQIIQRFTRAKFALLCFTPAEMFFSCCDSVAAPRATTLAPRSSAGTTSGAAGNGLGTTIKYLRGAAGIGLGTTIKYLRGAVDFGLGTTIKRLRGAAASIWAPQLSTCDAQRADPRATAWVPRSSTCAVPRTSARAQR